MMLAWMDNVCHLIGRDNNKEGKKSSSKYVGFKGTPYEKIINNLETNPIKNMYLEWEKDIMEYLQNGPS